MNKRSGAGSVYRLLLDSFYLLPIFDIEVNCINDEDLERLSELAVSGYVKLYYSPFSLVEIVAKLPKESLKRKIRLNPADIEASIQAIQNSSYMEPAHPDARAYAIAFRMKLLGYKDIIDNILYATAVVRDLLFIIIDKKAREFRATLRNWRISYSITQRIFYFI